MLLHVHACVCVWQCVLVCLQVPLFVPHWTSWGLFSVFLLFFLLVFSICNAIFRFWPAGIGIELRVDNAAATAADVARGWRCRQRWQRLRLETWQVRGATAKLVWRRLKVVQGVRYKFAVPAVPTVRLSARIYAPEMPLASCVLCLRVCVCVCVFGRRLSFHNFPQLAAPVPAPAIGNFTSCKLQAALS